MTGPSDEIEPDRRQPIFNLPGVIAWSCVVLLALYGLYAFASLESQTWVIAHFAFVPARMAIALDVARPALRASVQQVPEDAFSLLIGTGGGRWWTLFTYALLHGSVAHVGLNCLWLVIFGSPVARRLGAARFLVLALAAIVVGALCVFLWSPASFMPIVGASAGVAGAAGAAVRFIFRPGGEPVFQSPLRRENDLRQPTLTLHETFANRAGLLFIVLFLGSQALTAVFPGISGFGAPVAWQAHIGGFLIGLLLMPLLDPVRPAPTKEPLGDARPPA